MPKVLSAKNDFEGKSTFESTQAPIHGHIIPFVCKRGQNHEGNVI